MTFHRPRDVGEGAHRARETPDSDALVGDGERSTGRDYTVRGDTARTPAGTFRPAPSRKSPRGTRRTPPRLRFPNKTPRDTARTPSRPSPTNSSPRDTLRTRAVPSRSPPTRACPRGQSSHAVFPSPRVRARRARVARRQSRGGRTRPRRTPARTSSNLGRRRNFRSGTPNSLTRICFVRPEGRWRRARLARRRRRRLVRSGRARRTPRALQTR